MQTSVERQEGIGGHSRLLDFFLFAMVPWKHLLKEEQE